MRISPSCFWKNIVEIKKHRDKLKNDSISWLTLPVTCTDTLKKVL